jgi:hypothetical protein
LSKSTHVFPLANSVFKQNSLTPVYLNHKKYIVLSTTNFNQLSAEPPKEPDGSNEQKFSQDQKQEAPKNRFYRLFQKENAWKLSLGIIGIMCTSLVGYLLVVWGAPQVDQLGNTVRNLAK